MTDSYYDTVTITEAIARAAANGDAIHNSDDVAAYDLCGVLPARPVAARTLAYAVQATTSDAEERSALTRVVHARNDAELAMARENARLVKLALIAAAA